MIEAPLGAPKPPDRRTDLTGAVLATFERVLAAFLLAATLLIWAHVMGTDAWLGPAFLDAAVPTRAVIGAMAVMLPLASLGLWTGQAWGRVVWLFAVVLHVTALSRGWVPPIAAGTLLAFHTITIGLFVAFQIARFWDLRRLRSARTR